MNIKTLTEKTMPLLAKYPDLSEQIVDLYQLALDEIKEGGSENHECELAYNDILDLIESHKIKEMINHPINDLKKEEEENWKREQQNKP